MKLSFLTLLLFTSCGHLSYGTLYRVDTAKQFDCGQMTLFTAEVEKGLRPDPDLKLKLEREAGFRNCTYTNPTEESLLMECTEPKVYRSLFTKKSSECVAFRKAL